VETESDKYPQRTFANVRDSDGTIRFCKFFLTRGEICTLNALEKYRKPFFDVSLIFQPERQDVVKWLVEGNIHILNVAGNKESIAKGIEVYTRDFLIDIFDELKSRK
jgi:hypothetical protein